MEHPKRRRRMIVDSEVQRRMILSVSWPPALFLMMTAMALGVFTTRLHNEALDANVELTSLLPVFWTLGSFLVFALAFVAFNALRFSHRIAGPTYRLLKTMEAACKGDHAIRARLREGDYLQDLATGLNQLLDRLQKLAPPTETEAAAAEQTPADVDEPASVS